MLDAVAAQRRPLENRYDYRDVAMETCAKDFAVQGDGVELDRIAIVGMALRFPGADTPEAFWRNLSQGVESISRFSREALLAAGVPAEKLDDPAYVPVAGCLEDIDFFDAALFNIGPHEAEIMDPQQRLFLTVAREALEEAGLANDAAVGRVGVFAGSSISTYLLNNLHGLLDPSGADLNIAKLVANDKDYLATLTAHKLDLRGPAVTVQTACSTSLVAVHQACQALLSMECDAALAGGVTVRVPHRVGYSNQGGSMLSANGHCRAFDADADGTVPGSGAGAVVLKRLEDARRDGDPIHAVILGSAVNNDGAGKIGFTAPSVSGQVDVIVRALAMADIEAGSIGYIETHGTGTRLGDPVEIAALNQVLGGARAAKSHCAIGSVKSNVGHLECAAGVAGLIKTVLALKHAQVPPSLGFSAPNPEAALGESPVYVNSTLCDWPLAGTLRRAGVSSFGFGGTNCHMVLEEASVRPAPAVVTPPVPCLLPLSARQALTLAELRGRYLSFLREDESPSLYEICFSAAKTRRHEGHRAVLLGRSREEMLGGLRAWAQHASHPTLLGAAEAPEKPPLRAFLFAGQDRLQPGVGRTLYANEPVFREVVDRCDLLLAEGGGHPVASLFLTAADDAEAAKLLEQPRYSHPALIVLEYALAELWMSWGIRPDFVLGHGLGEYAAAAVAGALSWNDALRLVARRAQLMQALDPAGGMLALFASETTVTELLQRIGSKAEITELNGPANIVVGGTEDALNSVRQAAEGEGISTEPLRTPYVRHNALLTPILDALEQEAAQLPLRDPSIPLVSTLTGALLEKGAHSPRHWRDHSRKPVRFAAGIDVLIHEGCRDFVEIGPHPQLCRMGRACDSGEDMAWFPSLRRDEDAAVQVRRTLGALYLRGATVGWDALYAGNPQPRPVHLPVMPVRGERYWLEPVRRAILRDDSPGLLGRTLPSAVLSGQYEAAFSTGRMPFFADHAIASGAIFPATGYLDMALTAVQDCLGMGGVPVLREVEIAQPLMLNETERQVQTVVRSDGGAYTVEIFSRNPVDKHNGWLQHCRMRAEEPGGPDMMAVLDIAALRAGCTRTISAEVFYGQTRLRGMQYGPAFRLVSGIDAAQSVSIARVRAGRRMGGPFDPALLDACCQAAGVFFFDQSETDNFLPVAIGRVQLHRELPAEVTSRAELKTLDQNGAIVDITVCDVSGRILAELTGMRFRRVARGSDTLVTPQTCLYVSTWVRVSPPDSTRIRGRWLLVAERAARFEALARLLKEAGAEVMTAEFGEGFAEGDGTGFTFDPTDPKQAELLLDTAAGESELEGIVQFWPKGDGSRGMAATLHLLQAMIARAATSSLTVVTCNAQRIGPQAAPCDPDPARVWGFAAGLREEHPELPLRLIDLDTQNTAVAAEAVFAELGCTDDEDRLTWRDGTRFVQRLTRRPAPLPRPYRLHPSSSGLLDQMQVKPLALQAPGAQEMRLRVHATGLNFRDVINALGMFPGADGPLGGECAGVVEAVGEDVDPTWIGRRVVCGASGAFSSHIISDARLVTPMPERFSFEQAATLPVAYVTAHYALNRVAGLGRGERVLIHAGAGGVGQAAIQIAKARGAEIYTTAGAPRKREFLQEQGIAHVMDSRSLDFAGEIRAVTHGEGVDVVLNALSDSFIPESLALLREGGRFLEIGKLGIWTPQRVAQTFPHVRYHVIALDRLIDEAPDSVKTLLDEVMEAVAGGVWQLPPLRVFDFSEAGEAFRYMQQARHIGKIAVRHAVPAPLTCRADASYLITGGTGALGLETAERLVSLGARQLVLASRSPPGKQAQARISAIAASGVDVRCRQIDVTDPRQATTLLDEIRAGGRPLRGVIHAAGVLEDMPVTGQRWDAFQRVLAPKVVGGQILSRETLSDPIDFFILYASASAELGAAGQGAYAAANAYLDGLADQRAMSGLPALSMAWGPWSAGMTESLTEANRKRMAALGVGIPGGAQYLDLMERCAADGDTRAVAMVVDWERFRSRPGRSHSRYRLQGLIADTGGDRAATERWAEAIEAMPCVQRRDALISRIWEQAARVLGLGGGAPPDSNASLLELGLDSLMAVELRNALGEAIGHRLPATLLFDYPSPAQLADHFGEELFDWWQAAGEAADTAAIPAEAQPFLSEQDDEMSDEAAAALITAELEKWSQRNA